MNITIQPITTEELCKRFPWLDVGLSDLEKNFTALGSTEEKIQVLKAVLCLVAAMTQSITSKYWDLIGKIIDMMKASETRSQN